MTSSVHSFNRSNDVPLIPLITLSDSRRIQNPLHGLSRDALLKRVDAFTHEYGLEDKRELFEKGAMIAQEPAKWESVPGLTEEEKEMIRRETTREFEYALFVFGFVGNVNAADGVRRSMESVSGYVQDDCHLQLGCSSSVRASTPYEIDFRIDALGFRGWDQTGSNGANLSFPEALGLSTAPGHPNAKTNEWIIGAINSG